MSFCRHCNDGLPIYLIDEDGIAVRLSGKRVDVIGHALDDYFWPCPLAPQPPDSTFEPYIPEEELDDDPPDRSAPGEGT